MWKAVLGFLVILYLGILVACGGILWENHGAKESAHTHQHMMQMGHMHGQGNEIPADASEGRGKGAIRDQEKLPSAVNEATEQEEACP